MLYDLETYNTINCAPYAKGIQKLSKISGNYHRDITEKEYQKCQSDCIVFKGLDNINKKLDHILSFKAEPKKSNRKC